MTQSARKWTHLDAVRCSLVLGPVVPALYLTTVGVSVESINAAIVLFGGSLAAPFLLLLLSFAIIGGSDATTDD